MHQFELEKLLGIFLDFFYSCVDELEFNNCISPLVIHELCKQLCYNSRSICKENKVNN
jgi:hypothetical protein